MFKLTVNLNEKIKALHQRYVINPNLGTRDERNQSLGALNITAFWLNIQLMLYVLTKRTDPVPQKILLLNPDSTNDELLRTYYNLDLTNMRAFLTLFLAHVEVLLERLSKLLPNSESSYGYKNLIKHILKELSLTTSDNELFFTLYFPAIIRNTLHTNGIHTDETITGKISGILFKFEKDKHVLSCWRQIYFLCDKVLDTLDVILRHPMIKDKPLPTPNVDPVNFK
ncbi:MAG: hypothetical protein KGI33_08040 [Thaumarchaeota archaeon]|nr:hypothetical protein [Nitrososphaerota archaeon]